MPAINRVVNLPDEASPIIDPTLGDEYDLTASQDSEIGISAGGYLGQRIIIKHTASGAARTLSLSSDFLFGTDITALTPTLEDTSDYIGVTLNESGSEWNVISYIKGLPI
jgi:hypothetical protein